MHSSDAILIDEIRAASRQMVRELGFMRSAVADTGYAPSFVHAILEIGARGEMTAAQLGQCLALEKSTVSRMVCKLVDAGEVQEMQSETDARQKLLSLTAQGRKTLAAIHAFGRRQVANALERLTEAQRQMVRQGLDTYARALHAHRSGEPLAPPAGIRIVQGYRPGVIGRIVDMHGSFYSRHVGFSQFFESKVAASLAEFSGRLEHPCNALWTAFDAGRAVGSVAIDGEDLGGNVAHLRWFIIEDGMRGFGLGRKLLKRAVSFCDDRGFAATRLWTLKGLDAARKLYEEAGFVLEQEYPGDQWGKRVIEQCFVRAGQTGKNA